jgi:hypothetical protein
MVVHSTQEVEARGLQIQGQPGLRSETLSQKKTKIKTRCQWLMPVSLLT